MRACPESSKAFTNGHFDRFKSACLAIINGKNDPHTADEDGARRRLVWRIKSDAKKAGLDNAYISAVARDLAVLGNWEDLDIPGLTNLMHTIHNRAGATCEPSPPPDQYKNPKRESGRVRLEPTTLETNRRIIFCNGSEVE